MEILLWLVPSAVVTVLAMLWAGWRGREERAEIDRDEAVRRLAVALEPDRHASRRTPLRPRRGRRPAPGYAASRPDPDRSSGVAVRPSRRAS